MNNYILFYNVISKFNALLSLLCGLVVIYSISHQPKAYAVNLVVACAFVFISIFTYVKMQRTHNAMKDSSCSVTKRLFMRVNLFQAAFYTFVFLCIIFAVVSRAFGEQQPVFD